MTDRATDTAAEKRILRAVWIVVCLAALAVLTVVAGVVSIVRWLWRIVSP